MSPLPPVRLSTMNCWPIVSPSRCARLRAMMSVPPVAVNGTTMRTVLAGYSCARAVPAWTTAAAATIAQSQAIALIPESLHPYAPAAPRDDITWPE
jgi:hypothetical protein